MVYKIVEFLIQALIFLCCALFVMGVFIGLIRFLLE